MYEEHYGQCSGTRLPWVPEKRGRKVDHSNSELIREAMEYSVQDRLPKSRSVLEFPPSDLGKMKEPLCPKDDLLAEMTHDLRD